MDNLRIVRRKESILVPYSPVPSSLAPLSPRLQRGSKGNRLHAVRLVGGVLRGRKLPVLDAPGLRPTPDRVRETLFNWLGQDLQGWRCMDAFAGSGALGWEAVSRGAAWVSWVDRNPAVVAQLRALRTMFGAEQSEVLWGDGITALERCAPGSVDVVFLDPPFHEAIPVAQAVRLAARAIGSDGFVYLESARRWMPEELHPLAIHRHTRAGAVHAHLLAYRPPSGDDGMAGMPMEGACDAKARCNNG